MSQKAPALLLSCLRRTLDATRHGQASDRELLEHYLNGQDAGAFVALLHRHGTRVFATCRRVLYHEADVEDAFQATFLVLLDKARSVRWEPSLGNWLAAVAHRVAVRTRGRKAKRAGREAQCDLPETAAREGGDDLLWREACAVLHEELDRLPDQLRLPLVLCCLEGLPRDEAAQSLGCSLDTIKGRLERGRIRLRERLARRGLSLSAGLLGTLAVSAVGVSAATASGPPLHLFQATIQAAAGPLPARLGPLVYGGSQLMKSKCKLLAATVLALGLMSGAGLWLFGAAPPAGPQSAPGEAAQVAAVRADEVPQARDDKKPAEPAKDAPKDTFEVSGSVLGVDGKPCAGVKLFAPKLKKAMPTSLDDIGAEEVGTTGTDGQFRVTVKALSLGRTYLIARADEAGVDFIELDGKPLDKVTLKLVKDQPITGRLVDTEGKPVAGVTVGLEGIYLPGEGQLDDYLTGWKKNWRDTASTVNKRLYLPLDDITGRATSDKDGRFKLTGAGAERIVQVAIHGSGVARSVPHVITRDRFDPKPYNEATTAQTPVELRRGGEVPTLYGPDFTFVVVKGKSIEGVVKDAATGKPVAEVSLFALAGQGNGVTAKTDKDGKYRLEGLPQEKAYHVFAEPPKDSAYLRRGADPEGTPGTTPIRLDFELVKGVVVTGRVLDSQTGKGVAGGIRFAPLPKNKYFEKPGYDGYQRDHTMQTVDADGRFRVVTIPGESLLMIQVYARDKVDGLELSPYRTAVPDPDYKDLFKYEKDDDTWLFTSASSGLEILSLENVVKVVDLKENGGEVKVELNVERGKTAQIVVQDADGKPLSGVVASGLTAQWPITFKLNEAKATVFALNPDKPRRVMFLHPEKKLGGTVIVRGDEKEPVVVRLAPLGTVTSRFVDNDGVPLGGASVSVRYEDRIGSELTRYLERTQPEVKADKEGRFTITGIVPGVKFSLQTRQGESYYLGEPRIGLKEVEAGKTLDLGERKLKPQ